MAERPVDGPSLVVGLLAVAAAALVLLDRSGAVDVDGAVAVSALVVVAAVAGLVCAALRLRTRREPAGSWTRGS